MTRAKKYARAKGMKFDEDYLYMPFPVNDSISIEGIEFDAETMTIVTCYNVLSVAMHVERDGTVVDVDMGECKSMH